MRCFLGIRVEPERSVLDELEKLSKIDYVKTVKPENLQVDLRFFGELDEQEVSEVQKALSALEFNSFTIRLEGLGVFPGQGFVRVVWAGVKSEEVYVLKQKVDQALSPLGYAPAKTFVPHLTLGRVKRKPDERLKKILSEDRDRFFQTQLVKEIRMYQSILKREGPEYSVLWRVKLG